METFLSFIAAAAVKAAVILALAGLLTAVWRSASASARHLIWTVAVASALVLPIAGLLISRFDGPRIPVRMWAPVVSVRANIAPAPLESVPAPASAKSAGATPDVEPLTHLARETPIETQLGTLPEISTPMESPVTARSEAPALVSVVISSVTGNVLGQWRTGLIILWAGGALLALLPLLLAMVRIRILARNATPANGARWFRLMQQTPAIRHLAFRVTIIESTETSMPMTWGVLRPTLLLPANAERWPEWQCRNILLHELAHVERRDCLSQLIAQVTCAIYWFNPLAWVAAHRMRVERELACDDCVISAGSAPSDYAENLLDVARSLRAPAFTSHSAIAMARPSQLSVRLLAVLDSRRNRAGIDRRAFAAATFAALAVLLPVASMTPRSAEAAASDPQSSRVAVATENARVKIGTPTGHQLLPGPVAIVRATQIPAGRLVVPAATAAAPSVESVFSSKPVAVAEPAVSPLEPPAAQDPSPCWTGGDGKSNTSISNNDKSGTSSSWHIRYTRDDCSLELRAEGKFTLRGDLSDVQSISSNGWFRLEERNGRITRRMDIRPAAGGSLEHLYYVNGDRAAFDEHARAWLAETLLAVERRTAFAAETRVPQLHRTGGLRGVLSEISRMPSAYAKSRYYEAVLEMETALGTGELNEVVRQASTDLTSSDYYMSQVLGKLASQRTANESTWRIFAEAAGRMKSDYYKSTVLKKVLNSGRLSNETVGVLLQSASGIKSDYYLTELLKSVAGKYAVNAQTRGFYVDALGKIESDYYRSELLKTISKQGPWDERTTSFVLTSVSGIRSDNYKSEALISLLREKHVNSWPAFFNAAATIGSDHYKRQTLAATLRHDPLTREIVSGVLATAERIKSDHEAAEVLTAVARTYRIDDGLRPAYERVVDSMDSDHYRGTALSALRRSMTR